MPGYAKWEDARSGRVLPITTIAVLLDLGAEVQGIAGGGFDVVADRLAGSYMYCDLPSHTGVENLVMAASLGGRRVGNRKCGLRS